MVRRQAAQAAVGWQEHPDLRVDAQVDAVRQRHGRSDRSSADVDLGLLSLAASWRSGLGNQLSVRLRAGDTRYPNPVVDAAGNRIANGHRLIDAQAGIDWQPGGHSRVAARLGWGARRHDERSERNTSGLTSSLEGTLAPTAAQVVSLTWHRDLAPLDDLDRLFAVSSTATLGWRWTPWAQWQFDAGTAWRSTRFRGAPQADLADATLGRPDQRDRWQQWQLAGRWLPHESLQVQGTVQQQERRSNRSGRDYRSHSIEVATQWTF